jgi:Cof subfamily protein (haloacid dehalogenase superfamily)
MKFIALDIDGTITDQMHSIPKRVVSYLKSLQSRGWRIIVLTGRPYCFCVRALSSFDFPYIFSSQNGSFAWDMPRKKTIFKSFIKKGILEVIEKEMGDLDVFMMVYGRNNCFVKEVKGFENYVEKFENLLGREVFYLKNFSHSHLKGLALAKCVGPKEELEILQERLKKVFRDLEIHFVKDVFIGGDYYLLLITDGKISKGSAILKILEFEKVKKGVVIAAGNDVNDLSMFNVSDIKIAMEDSPKKLLENADIIAPSSKKEGIIEGLKLAIKKHENIFF